ncbi:thiamine phosphate synthase [bacterium]|nr:thiamine phosphate synthase [bacterium]
MARLYLITDPLLDSKELLHLYDEAMLGGLGLFQLRVKGLDDSCFFKLAEEFSNRCSKAGVALIINDRPDIAMLVGAAGVHVGRCDLPVKTVRRLVGDDMLVGSSIHDPSQAVAAVRAGASYVAIGPCFATSVKPDQRPVGITVLRQTVSATDAPVCAIGGITPVNLGEVLDARPAYAAVITAVSRSDSPLRVKEFLLEEMKRDGGLTLQDI